MIDLAWANLRKINPELPAAHTLSEAHADQLARSGITPLQAAIAGIFSADAELAHQLTGYDCPGLLFSYFDPKGRLYFWDDGEGANKPFFRLRPDDGKSKYLSPKDAPVFIYIPRTANYTWIRDGDSMIKPGQNIVITEGEKKALSATLNGIPCLGLGGVNSYKTGIKDEADEMRSLGFFINELDILAQQSLIICYDSDVIQKPQVAQAIKSFAYSIADAYKQREIQGGAGVVNKTQRLNDILKYSLLPSLPGEKVGLDDAIVRWGADAVKELLGSAMPLVKIERSKNDPKDITTKQLFCTEPRGDNAPDKIAVHLQNHNRALISWLYFCNRVMNVPGMGFLQYDQDKGTWKQISEKQWTNLPEQVSDSQGWRNRTSALQKQSLAMVNNRLLVEIDDLNNPRYLAFTNGVLDLEEKTLLPHSPTYKMTRRLGFDYMPMANCPNFLNWLFFLFAEKRPNGEYDPDSELCASTIEFVRALLRFAITPKPHGEPYPVEVFIYLLGRPKKGKGTFIEIIQGLAGEACASWTLESIGEATGRFPLMGKLIGTCTELKGVASAKAIAAINQAATNEEMEVRSLYSDATSTRLNTVLVAASNEPITSAKGDRGGLDRRAAYLKVDRDIEKPDPHFKARLKKELPGIYNWITQISFEEAVTNITAYRDGVQNVSLQKEMLDGQSSVYRWMVDRDSEDINLYCDPGVQVKARIAYGRYKSWCSIYNYQPLQYMNWRKEMVKGGTKVIETNYTYLVAPEKDAVNIDNMLGL